MHALAPPTLLHGGRSRAVPTVVDVSRAAPPRMIVVIVLVLIVLVDGTTKHGAANNVDAP